ncbi:MAG TPA: sulfotransferase family 2 domain-containing protein [Gammaproteobacteria bacterium]|nr:sulfotransferase family 2 domain-containing protein [Gammaproteobacteria bacterium]
MRISPSKRFILLHVPRTGVSSIIAALDEDLFVRAPPTRLNRLMSKHVPILRRPLEKTYLRPHETAAHVRRLLPAGAFDGYRRIAFVRNPFSWLVSLYELILQSQNHRHHARVRTLKGFSDYIDWEIGRSKRTQHPYLLDRRGRLLVDHVGRFERLTADAARIFAAIGVELKPLPRIGQLTRRDYREFYDESSRRKVAAHWARDLELLGYDFDGPIREIGPPGSLPG